MKIVYEYLLRNCKQALFLSLFASEAVRIKAEEARDGVLD
jgi:hypothetical protein